MDLEKVTKKELRAYEQRMRRLAKKHGLGINKRRVPEGISTLMPYLVYDINTKILKSGEHGLSIDELEKWLID